MIYTKFDDWEEAAIAWLDGRQMEPPEPLRTGEVLGLLQLCKRACAIEHSVTQGQERALRDGYARMLDEVLGIREASEHHERKGGSDE